MSVERPKNAHRSIAEIFALAMIVLGCTVLGFEDTGAADAETDGQFPIDLDGDGTVDFVLERPRPRGHETIKAQGVKIAPNRNNGIVREKRGEGYVAALKEGDLIGQTLPDTLKWVSKASHLYRVIYHSYPDSSFVQWIGSWPARSDRYLGLKLNKGGKTYYGWAQVHVDTSVTDGSVQVRATGYNSSPGQFIRAGLGQ